MAIYWGDTTVTDELSSTVLSHDKAMQEAERYIRKAQTMSHGGALMLLASMLQRVHQEGVLVGHDRAAAVIKRHSR